jgi:heavy metal sensor kinase
MISQLPLRIRLTLWYTASFAVALLCVGSGCLWMVHRSTIELENNELQQRVRSVRRFLEARPASETAAQRHDAITAAYDVSHGSKWLQVIDQDGQWVYRSSHVAAAYPQLALPQQAPQTEAYFTYLSDGIHVRALIAPISAHGVRYTVQTGLSLTKTMVILTNFNIQLALLSILSLLASSVAGYFMSRKALTPIAAIAAEAQRINDRNLNTRLPELESHDELARLSTTLNQMLGRIESGYQSVRSFTANAAHELRTPVALLRAETEVALSFPRDAAYYKQTCESVLENSIQMSRLIDQLLTLARTDAGVELLQREPLNLAELVSEAASQWNAIFASAGVGFHTERSPQDLWIEGDYAALQRLLNTLLENAWRYTPAGQTVTLALCPVADTVEPGTVQLSVTDTGVGIAPEAQARIFERFYRAAQPVRGDFSGSGLGLVLAQWIAEGHDAKLQVESTPGEGSRFSLRLHTTTPPATSKETYPPNRKETPAFNQVQPEKPVR